MNGGTYAEAIKAGFTDEQAGFFSRAFCETKSECWQGVKNLLVEERKRPLIIVAKTWRQWTLIGCVFMAGFIAGVAV